jgi:hypothetical protein
MFPYTFNSDSTIDTFRYDEYHIPKKITEKFDKNGNLIERIITK